MRVGSSLLASVLRIQYNYEYKYIYNSLELMLVNAIDFLLAV